MIEGLVEPSLQQQIDDTALALARRGGAAILGALRERIEVEYKGDATQLADPVSSVDRAIEREARTILEAAFPSHGILGEESSVVTHPDADVVWAIDPIDGTSNFVRRYPMFGCSIGVLSRGRPISGAVWCSATPDCRPGVFHTRQGRLSLDGDALPPLARVGGPVRRLVGDVGPAPRRAAPFDRRVSGSAALECVLVAAGVLDAARFRRLWLWDVAGGIALVRAAGVPIWVGGRAGWTPFTAFHPPRRSRSGREPTLRDWHRPLLLGDLGAAGRPA